MKKRLAMILAGTLAFSMLLSGCASNEASNEYVSIEGYKGIEVPKIADAAEVTDEQVEDYINSILQQNATAKEVTDRGAKDGDTVNVDYVGVSEGVEFEGGSAQGADIVLGQGGYIEGFAESLNGHKAGDTFAWEGQFPEDYSNTDLAGKPVTFTFTVNSVNQSVTPELDDDFVKSVSEKSKTVKEYKEEVKKTLEKDTKEQHDSELQTSVWSAVMEKAEVKKYDKDKVKEISEKLIQQYKDAAEYYQMEYEEFLESQVQLKVEDFEKQVKEAAESSEKQTMVAQVIAKKEKLEPSDEEYQKEFEKLAEQYGYEDVDAMKEIATEEELKSMVRQTIVKEWLTENCIQVVSDDKEE